MKITKRVSQFEPLFGRRRKAGGTVHPEVVERAMADMTTYREALGRICLTLRSIDRDPLLVVVAKAEECKMIASWALIGASGQVAVWEAAKERQTDAS